MLSRFFKLVGGITTVVFIPYGISKIPFVKRFMGVVPSMPDDLVVSWICGLLFMVLVAAAIAVACLLVGYIIFGGEEEDPEKEAQIIYGGYFKNKSKKKKR